MTVTRWSRNPSPVEAIHLDDLPALHCAEMWLRGHGVPAAHRHPTIAGRALLLPHGPGGLVEVARLGQWLVLDGTTGRFAVADDGDFRALHTERPPAAVLPPRSVETRG